MTAMMAFIAVSGASVALAWDDLYVHNEVFFPTDDDESGFNSNLVGNAVDFGNIYGGNPNMGSRYINSFGEGLNTFQWDNSSFVDERDVAYGAAQCRANSANQYNVYVYQCYTAN